MKKLINTERLRFYGWVGLAYLSLWVFVDLVSQFKNFGHFVVNEIWRTPFIIIVNFIFFEYSLPRISRKRMLYSFLFIVVQLFVFASGLYIWRYTGIQLHIHTSFVTYSSIAHGIADQLTAVVFSFCFFGIFRHIYNYRKLKIATQQLRIEKQEAELNYLKSQTNPHFLFNTLNNIYSLARDKSDLAPESILRLSKILRYMLYETNGEYIAIEQELKIINDYIALEKLRYDDSLTINFNHDVEDFKQALPPLLLIPLVENAFKHGVSETRNQPFVDIHLSVNNRQLIFRVKNSTEEFSGAGNIKENIGLSNLRRQLELLYTDYQLSVQQGESLFIATLKINLASHVKSKMHYNRG